MTTIKDLFENEELMENIVEDLDDLPEDAEVTYEVWALGYTADEDCTDDEVLMGEFTDPDEAIKCAESVTLERIRELGYGEADPATAYFSIEVETVVEDPEDEDGGTMNLGTVYSREIWLDSSNEDVDNEEDFTNIVEVSNKDIELTEDGMLKVSCELLKGFYKNCFVRFRFVDEAETGTFLYQIREKVEYKDGDYFHCELMI